MANPILTPPPYRPNQSVQVQCPICKETRWIQWDKKYRHDFTGRCHQCSRIQMAKGKNRECALARGERVRQRRYTELSEKFGKPWKTCVESA